MSNPEPFVTRAEDVETVVWDDPRGCLSFQTLISGETTPSNGLVAGVSTLEPGGAWALHSHAQPEVYFILEGTATVTIDGVDRTVTPGAAVFIPGHARHTVRNASDAPFKIFYVFPADRFDQIHYDFVDQK